LHPVRVLTARGCGCFGVDGRDVAAAAHRADAKE
jgi:hypothetical protein